MLIVYSIPTAVLYWFITQSSFRITRLEGLILAFGGAQAIMTCWSMIKVGTTSPVMWGGLLILVALLIWYGIRPGRGPTIALLAYVGIVLLLSNLWSLIAQPWGSALHKAAFGALVLRLILAGLLVVDLRRKADPGCKVGHRSPHSKI